ncbi:MAG: hypothetical protein ACU84J_01345 [Gammaproteobacteria bacterium]
MDERKQFLIRTVLISLLLSSDISLAASIDLNDFFFFSGDPVVVASDGSSATLSEDPNLSSVILSNDPGLGDAEVIVAGNHISLLFDYDFAVGIGELDQFGAFIIDPATGFNIGAPFEFFATDTGSGTASFDLSSLAGMTGLGFQFELTSLSGDTGASSSVTVSNLRLETASVSVPEVPILLLLALGLCSLFSNVQNQRLLNSERMFDTRIF